MNDYGKTKQSCWTRYLLRCICRFMILHMTIKTFSHLNSEWFLLIILLISFDMEKIKIFQSLFCVWKPKYTDLLIWPKIQNHTFKGLIRNSGILAKIIISSLWQISNLFYMQYRAKNIVLNAYIKKEDKINSIHM